MSAWKREEKTPPLFFRESTGVDGHKDGEATCVTMNSGSPGRDVFPDWTK